MRACAFIRAARAQLGMMNVDQAATVERLLVEFLGDVY